MDTERRTEMPNGRREGDIFYKSWCDQRQAMCAKMHQNLHDEITEVKQSVERLDKRLFLILMALFANLLAVLAGVVTLIFKPVLADALVYVHGVFRMFG